MKGRNITILCLLLLCWQAMAKGKWFPFRPKNLKSHSSATTESSTWTKMGELSGAKAIWWLLGAKDGTIYAATTCWDMGRIFKSIDGCENWDTTATLSEKVGEALSILQSQDGALYVGTVGRDYVGRVFKSINGGDSWWEAGSFDGAAFFPLIETSDGALYAGAICLDEIGRIFKSQDSGKTWTISGEFEDVNGIFSLLRASDGVLYAGGGGEILERPPEGLYVYESADSGKSWVEAGFLERAMYIFSLLESRDKTLYVSTLCWKLLIYPDTTPPETLVVGKVFKSTNKGISWEEVLELDTVCLWSLMEAQNGVLYVGGISGGFPGEGGGEAKVFKSIDGGENWIDTGILEGANTVYSFLQTSDGSIYAGTGDENGDVFKYTTVGIKEEDISDKSSTLIVFPTPFRQGIRIKYQGVSGEVNLTIYDATGRLVRTLTRAQSQEPKICMVEWDGRNSEGVRVPSGIYFICLRTDKSIYTKRVVLIR